MGGHRVCPGRPAGPHLGVQLHPGLPAPCQEPGEGVGTTLPLGAALDRRLWMETWGEGEEAMRPIADPFGAAGFPRTLNLLGADAMTLSTRGPAPRGPGRALPGGRGFRPHRPG